MRVPVDGIIKYNIQKEKKEHKIPTEYNSIVLKHGMILKFNYGVAVDVIRKKIFIRLMYISKLRMDMEAD